MHCVPAIVLQTNKADAQCDKLATEPSWQRFAPQFANFQLLYRTCIYPTPPAFATSVGGDPVW